jgi:hypothetical protein
MTTENWLSISKANDFSSHDPKRGSIPQASGLYGFGSNPNNWLQPTSQNGFAQNYGGSCCGLSKVCGCPKGMGSISSNTEFSPFGSDIKGMGNVSSNTEFSPFGPDIKGMGKIQTPFHNARLYTGNYNLPNLPGDPLMYGLTTRGLAPDLGIPVRIGLQNFTSGL